jgi:predicted amidohydrolase
MEGLSIQFLREQAEKMNAAICGSLMIKENGFYYNRLICMQPDGSFIQYDKRHLFLLSDESTVFTGGNKRTILEIKGWKILPLVCYDLRFPVWSKNTFTGGRYEYDLLIYVANWPENRGNVWKTLLKARAIENQVFVAGVNRIGKDGAGTNHIGESMVIDPKGRVISSADPGEPAILTASLPFEELQAFRNSFCVGPDWDHFTIEM